MSEHIYSTDWEQFIAQTTKTKARRARVAREGMTDPKLAMIVALSEEWRSRHNTVDAARRLQWAQARIIEERRLTPDPAALRPYVDATTRALLPAIKVAPGRGQNRRRKEQHRNLARNFYASLDRGALRGRPVEKIIARESRESPQLWAAGHPYGPPVPREDLDALAATLRSLRPRVALKVARSRFNPAAMTPERALAIAMQVAAQ